MNWEYFLLLMIGYLFGQISLFLIQKLVTVYINKKNKKIFTNHKETKLSMDRTNIGSLESFIENIYGKEIKDSEDDFKILQSNKELEKEIKCFQCGKTLRKAGKYVCCINCLIYTEHENYDNQTTNVWKDLP